MKVGGGFIGGFLVLGFAIFITGLLTGMFAVDLVNLKSDSAVLFAMFSLGFLTGMLAVALALVSVKLLELRKTS